MDAAVLRQVEECDEVALTCSDRRHATEELRRWSETELEFCTRRALEEHRQAINAPTAAIAAAHLYLAASYSAKMAEELSRQAELEKLALSIA